MHIAMRTYGQTYLSGSFRLLWLLFLFLVKAIVIVIFIFHGVELGEYPTKLGVSVLLRIL